MYLCMKCRTEMEHCLETNKYVCECGYEESPSAEGFVGVLSMDFDGVMNMYTGYDGEDNLFELRPGLEDFLLRCRNLGFHTFYIHSARNPEKIREWLVKHNVDNYFKHVTKEKLPADVYLDDRAVCFKGDFDRAFEDVKKFKVHWR